MKYLIFYLLFLFSLSAAAQEDLLLLLNEEQKDEKVAALFKSARVINAQTSETVSAGVLDFRITHRFGNMGSNAGGGPHNLWGFDNASNIRFSFDYGITDRLQAGIGRSKFREHLDGSLKFKLLEQTTQKIPFSVTLFTITAFTPERDFAGRYRKPEHRFSFAHQVIIARKFSEGFSFALLPSWVHRNLADSDINPANMASETNDFFSLGMTGRLRVTRRMAIVADYFYNFSAYRRNNPSRPYFNPLSVGLEIETGGHVFHVNLSNSAGIIENDFIPDTRDTWYDGGFKLGFHISRIFYF
jgi:hypothetical protein